MIFCLVENLYLNEYKCSLDNPIDIVLCVAIFILISLTYFLCLLGFSAFAVRFNEVLDEIQPDIVNAHHAFGKSFIAMLICKKKGIPVVLTSYSEMLWWKEKEGEKSWAERYDKMFKYVAKNSAHIISPSAHCAKGPLKYVSEDKVTVVYSGIDIQTYEKYLEIKKEEAKNKIGLKNKKIALFVGQLHWRKGPQFLAKTAPKIVEEIPDSRIVFVGSDLGMKKEIEKITDDVKENILFMDSVSEEDLPLYIRAADILIFPSITESECMGMSMKEAMLLETPVIGFKIAGIPEAVIDGKTGFLVEVGDYEMLANKTVECLKKEESIRELGENAKIRALELFDSRITGRGSLEIINEHLHEI
ncbi:MAG: glycosyltransferase family 4 protein [Methanocellales archaeon]|nr:glycosyltransferase family 4 protein [Methanocellales archaeon]MDD3291880.1 glycosyltransferase family 4 protein [Methanocellales archaeon]MDD5235523.1 glycosyltransferase family 4 protein [Methanocellales archaeon]